MRLVHLPESLDATKEDLLGHRQRVTNRIEATQEGPVGLRLLAADGTKRGHYIALSHCWGTQTPLRTIVRNFERACAENSMG
jgi:hypothetical protein